MSDRYPEAIRKLNDRLRADLGSNPRYAWRWSEDLWHVMEVVDESGIPQYVEDNSGLVTVMVPATIRRKLLPFHENQWIACALVPVNLRDGSLTETGDHAWIPMSSNNSGPVCLPQGEKPDLSHTQALISAIRESRSKSATEMGNIWTEQMAQREKAHHAKIYDAIRNEASAFANMPGQKGHVSFPTPQHLIQ